MIATTNAWFDHEKIMHYNWWLGRNKIGDGPLDDVKRSTKIFIDIKKWNQNKLSKILFQTN